MCTNFLKSFLLIKGILLGIHISIVLTFFFIVTPQADIILSAGESYEVVHIKKAIIIKIKMQEYLWKVTVLDLADIGRFQKLTHEFEDVSRIDKFISLIIRVWWHVLIEYLVYGVRPFQEESINFLSFILNFEFVICNLIKKIQNQLFCLFWK